MEHFRTGAGRRAVAEGAWVESASAVLWLIAAAALALSALRPHRHRLDFVLLGYVFLMFGLRELSLHSDVPPWDVDKVIEDGPAWMPLYVVFAAAAAVAIVVGYGLAGVRWFRLYRAAWREGCDWTRGAIWCVLLLGAGEEIEKVGHAVVGHHFLFKPGAGWMFIAAEESIELAAAVLALLFVTAAARYAWRPPRNGSAGPPISSTPDS